MIYDQRVLHNTTDISTLVNDFRAGAHTFAYETGDYLYVGSILPFNNLWVEMGVPNTVDVLEVQTLTFPALVGAAASDYIIIYDESGTAWAVALDTTGADADPTGAAWVAVAGAKKIKVDISGATTAAQVAALVYLGLNSLTGFTAVITLIDNANGTITATQTVYGATTNPSPHNSGDTTAGSITGVQTTAGSIGAEATVEIWFGNQWVSAVDLMDGTNGFSSSGRILWNTNIDKGWDLEQRSADVTGLSGTTIYNMYWTRISWDEDFNPLTTIKYIGQKFSTDDILFSFYPDFARTNVMTGFETGKTTWDEQHYMASEHIIRDLKKRNIIKSRGQILDYSLLVDASCHKVAEIIYQAFGLPYADQLSKARAMYKEAVELKNYNVDVNADGRLDPYDRCFDTGFGTR